MACAARQLYFMMQPVSGKATNAHTTQQGQNGGAILRHFSCSPSHFILESYFMKHAIAALFCLSALSAQAHEFSKLIKDRKYAEADKAASAKLAQDPKNADALIAKAELIVNQDQEARMDEGFKFGEQCVAAHPQNSECFEVMGSLYSMKALNSSMLSGLSNAGKAREALQKAVELNPKNFSARHTLLMFYLQAPGIAGGGMDKAQALQQDTAKVNKDAGNLLQARVLMKEDKQAQAESLALGANPGGIEGLEDIQISIMGSLGAQYREQKKFADSERLVRDMIKRAPGNISGHTLLGRTLAAQGKHEEAIKEYQKALTIEDRAGLHYRLAQSLQAMGDKARAAQGFEKALALKKGLDKKQREDAEQQLKALKA